MVFGTFQRLGSVLLPLLEKSKVGQVLLIRCGAMNPGSSDKTGPATKKDWDEMADWYDEKQGDEGDLWHRTLIDPVLLQLVGNVTGLKVLDLGCGNGYLSRKLAKQGADVTGVDSSARLIERAKARESQSRPGITYHNADAAHLEMLEDESFDIVLSNMALMDIARADLVIREASRALRPRARFVASFSHPCFDTGQSSGWLIERMGLTSTIWRKIGRYREPHEDWVPWNVPPGQVWETISYHRPLSWYFQALRDASLAVTAFKEPAPTQEFLSNSLQGEWIAQIPVHCVIEAVKLPRELIR